MFYKDWRLIYKRIAKDFKFPEKKEKKSAETLNSLLQSKKLHSIKHIEELIENKNVIVFGAGPSLEDSLIKHKNDFIGKLKIAADGATSALLEEQKEDTTEYYVFEDFNGILKKRVVEIVDRTEEFTTVSSGLDKNTSILRYPTPEMQEGDPLIPLPEGEEPAGGDLTPENVDGDATLEQPTDESTTDVEAENTDADTSTEGAE